MPGMELSAPGIDITVHRVAHAVANNWTLANISSNNSNVVFRAMFTM
jgi:hypothetical protein